MTFFEFIAEEVRELPGRARLPHASPRRSATSRCSTPPGRSTTGRPSGLDLSPILARAASPRRRSRCTSAVGQDHGLDEALDHELIRSPRRRIDDGDAGARRAADPQRQPHRRHACSATRSPSAYGGDGPARRHHRHHAHRLGRAELRRLRARAASRCGSRATPTTTSARACPAAGVIVRPTAGSPFVAEEQHHRRQRHRATAPPAARSSCAGVVGERFCVRNSGATRRRRGRRRPRLRVHDRRPVVVLGPTGRNFGAGMSGGIAYVLDLDGDAARSTARWSTSSARRRGRASSCATCRAAPRGDRLGGRRRGCSPTGTRTVEPVPQGHAPRLQAGARGGAKAADARASTPTATQVVRSGSWRRRPVADPKGFLHTRERELPPRRPVPVRIRDWKEVYEELRRRRARPASRPAGAWTAASRSATTAARSAT